MHTQSQSKADRSRGKSSSRLRYFPSVCIFSCWHSGQSQRALLHDPASRVAPDWLPDVVASPPAPWGPSATDDTRSLAHSLAKGRGTGSDGNTEARPPTCCSQARTKRFFCYTRHSLAESDCYGGLALPVAASHQEHFEFEATRRNSSSLFEKAVLLVLTQACLAREKYRVFSSVSHNLDLDRHWGQDSKK